MVDEINNKFNTNARLFNKDQLNKLLSELDIKLEPKKKTVKPLEKKKPESPVRLPQGDIEDILRQNFIQEDQLPE